MNRGATLGRRGVSLGSGLTRQARSTGIWTFADQAVSSASNVLTTVAIALLVERSAFDSFALAVTWFMIAITISRSVVGELMPAALSSLDHPAEVRRRIASEGVLFSASTGLVVTTLAAGVTALIARDSLMVVLVTGAFFPAMMAQDAARFAFFSVGRPIEALLLDSLWLVVQLGWWSVVYALGRHDNVELLVAGWGVGAIASLMVAWWRIGMTMTRPDGWWRRQHGRLLPCFVDGVLGRGALRVASVLAVGVTDASVLGPFRLARNLLGPTQNLLPLFFSFGVPRARQQIALGDERAARVSLRQLAVVIGVMVLAYTAGVGGLVTLWSDPPELWREALPIVLLLGLATLTQLPSLVIRARMRVDDQYGGVYGARLATSVMAFTLLPVGAALGGSFGLALATAAVTLLTSLVFVATARRSSRGDAINEI